MTVLVWVLSGLLAVVFLAVGAMKLVRDRQALAASGLAWTAGTGAAAVKAIGALEVAGAVGLILPALLDVAAWLSAAAAGGLTALMLGAVVVHVRRGERTAIGMPAGLAVLSAAVLVLRLVA